MKRIISFMLIFTLLFAINANAKSKSINDENHERKEYARVKEQYGLKSISKNDLPKGIKPLEFESIEEMETYLMGLEESQENINHKISESLSINEFPVINTSNTYGTNTKTVKKWCGLYSFNIKTKYNWAFSGNVYSFSRISSISCYLTGISSGLRWVTDYTDYDYNSDKTKCTVYVGGTLTNYIATPWGGYDIYTQDYDINTTITAKP